MAEQGLSEKADIPAYRWTTAEYNIAQLIKRVDGVEEANRQLTNENRLLTQRIVILEGIVKDQASHEDLVTWKGYVEENFDVLLESCHPTIHELFLTSILRFEGKSLGPPFYLATKTTLSTFYRDQKKKISRGKSSISFPSTLPHIYNLISEGSY